MLLGFFAFLAAPPLLPFRVLPFRVLHLTALRLTALRLMALRLMALRLMALHAFFWRPKTAPQRFNRLCSGSREDPLA